MISKGKLKLIRSLELKKNRKETGLFIAEGPKTVDELLQVFPCTLLAGTHEGLRGLTFRSRAEETVEVSSDELSQASLLKAPQEVLALFRQVQYPVDFSLPERSLCLALDNIQDPGNMGTIVRIADWFGIEHLFCSVGTADLYNPKTVQATMGAIARVQVCYVDLPDFLRHQPAGVPVYGTFLNGNNIYTHPLSPNGIVVMGNEGNGIGAEIEQSINQKLYIPPFPAGRRTSESLNVAAATAITCSEFRRRMVAERSCEQLSGIIKKRGKST